MIFAWATEMESRVGANLGGGMVNEFSVGHVEYQVLVRYPGAEAQ